MSSVKKIRTGKSGLTLGRAVFERISAVEGLALTPAMQADFAEFDRLKADAETRRKHLRKRYAG